MTRNIRRPSPSRRGSGRLLLAFGCAVAAQGAGAQSIGYQEEYQKLIDAEQQTAPLTDTLFGDSTSLYNGSTTFTQTDVSLKGNNALPVSFGRRFTVENRGGGGTTSNRFALGDWDLDVPYLSAVFVAGQGWVVQNPNGRQPSMLRCSLPQSAELAAPPDALDVNNQIVEADQYWIAPTMYVPGQGSQALLFKTAQSNAGPTDGTYRWVTANHWYLGCLDMGNGAEGFVARSPQGVTYHFNYEVRLTYPQIVRDLGPDAQGLNHSTIVNREEVRLYATRVEDRFANPSAAGHNYVQYNWNNGKLLSISSNDGRVLTLDYAGTPRVTSVSDGIRTWSYAYDPSLQYTLTGVTLPDASRWTFGLRNLQSGLPVYPAPAPSVIPVGSYCNKQKPLKEGADNVHSGWITHPSGATGTFTFQLLRHGRTNVDLQCDQLGVDEKYTAGRIPVQFDTHSLIRKEIAGPGLPSAYVWNYVYQLLPGSNICNPLGCPAQTLSKNVTVTAPDGVGTVHTFGVRYGENEGQLLGTIVQKPNGATVRQQTNEYVSTAEAASLPFPPQVGHLLNSRGDTMSTWLRPQKKRLTLQDGATFQWEGSKFDRFGRATRESRGGSTGNYYNVDQTVFDDNLDFWTLGQVATVHHVYDESTTREKVRNTYNAMAQLESESSWGKLTKSYTYRPDGTLAFATDAGGNATNFSQWQLGVPRKVTYQDGSFETATINTIGQITSLTDEVGGTVNFGYDPVSSRLVSMTPPGGDVVAWNTTTYQMEPVSANEYGIAPGHWRLTVKKGFASTITYYDALLRPVVTNELDTLRPAEQSLVARRYDHDGREVFVSRPVSTAFSNFATVTDGTSSYYDAIGRVLSTSEPSELGVLTTANEYLTGFKRRTTDARNYQTTTSFLAFDEPTYDYPTTIELPEGATTTISRDLWGKPFTLKRSGLLNGLEQSQQRRYAYDDNMRLCKVTEPETGFNTAAVIDYDAAGNIAWTALVPSTNWLQCERAAVPAASKSVRTYDTRNRLLNTTHPNAASVAQTWYADGALQTISSAGATWTYQYNKLRKLELETLAYDGKSFAFDWAYTSQGVVSSLTYPDGLAVAYAPDSLGRPTKVGTFASNVAYFANGATKSFDYGNGVRHTLTQNARQLALRSTDAKNGTPLVDFQYGYDRNANVDSIGDLAQGGLESKVLGYDGLNRLVSASASQLWGTGTFQYDPLDNLRSAQVGSRVYSYTYDGFANRVNQVTPNTGAAFNITYDARGNTATKGAQAFTFDGANRLLAATAPGGSAGGTENYVYDGHGRRVSVQKSGQAAKRYMVYGQGGQLLREVDEQNYATNYVYLGTSLVARTSEGGDVILVPAVPAPVSSSENPSLDGTYTITWNTPANATRYELQESINGNPPQTFNRTTASWVTPSARPVGTHGYTVRACNTAGCSAWTGTLDVQVQTAPPPAAPNPISASPNPSSNGLFTVTWTASSGATSYTLQETTPGNTGQRHTGTGTSWTTPVARADGTYSFYAQACNANGCSSSQTLTVSVQPIIVVLVPPEIVTALPSPSTDGNYTVSWSAAANATYYNVSEIANGQQLGMVYTTPDANTRQYVLANRPSGSYEYSVQTCDATRCSQWSGPATVVVQRPDTPAPPSSILVEGQTQVGCNGQNPRTFSVSWTPAGAQPDHFEIEETLNFATTSRFTVAGDKTFVSLTRNRIGPTIEAYYTYQIRACTAAGGDSGCSLWRGTAEICVGTVHRAGEAVISTTYYHTDALGSPVAETDVSGAVTKRTRYEPYGAPADANYVNGPGYTGHATDSLTKLSYMQQRYYDPLIGRFLSIDPVPADSTTGANFNRYFYATNNPYRYLDPDGRIIELVGAERQEFVMQRPAPPADFKQNYETAREYARSTGLDEGFRSLEASSTTYSIKPAEDRVNGRSYYDGNDNTIYWADQGGKRTLDGATGTVGVISPFLVLVHEVQHGANHEAGTYVQYKRIPDIAYDTLEERKVITGIEKKAAINLGQPQRVSHQPRPGPVKIEGPVIVRCNNPIKC